MTRLHALGLRRVPRALGALGALLGSLGACSPGTSGTAPPAVVDVKPVPSSRGAAIVAEADAGARSVVLPAIDAADRLVAEGRAYAERGEYPAALNRFETAYRIAGSDGVLYDIGRTLELMGRRGEAAEVYEKLLQGDLSHMDRMTMELRIKQLRGAP